VQPETSEQVEFDRAIEDAVERLQLAAEVEEVAGLAKPVRLRGKPRRERVARLLLGYARGRRESGRRTMIVDAGLVRALKLVVLGRRGWSAQTIAGKARPAERTGVAGYTTSSSSEDQVVRVSILLILMKRPRDAVDLLVARVRSGLPSGRTRRRLAYLLARTGEKKAAAALAQARPADAPRAVSGGYVRHRSSLRYGIVILTMGDSDVFRSSLNSLVRSDYLGDIIVVEDGPERTETCRGFCESVGLRYLKLASWEGSAVALNAGIAALDDDTDIVAFAHNDVLWPPAWFRRLDACWNAVYATQRVGLLNLGYLQYKPRLDPTLTELFVDGEYDDLRWLLTAMKDVPGLNVEIQDSQVRPGEHLFGLARDPWNDWAPDVRFMTGRFSVAASFPTEVWRTLGGFDPSLPYGFDTELQHYCLSSRRWILFANNPPLIHLASSDTRALGPEQRTQFRAKVRETYDAFERKYGWQIEHFLNVYFSESAFLHQDEIVRAANALKFDDIDFVFDDFESRLDSRTLANCELIWCRSRSSCRYVNAAAVAAAGGLARPVLPPG
jgi:glycosyl transferase family 2